MIKYFCDYQQGKKIWFGYGQHVNGNSYSCPGLIGCMGVICVPHQPGSQWFMGHSKLDPFHKELELKFWEYWSGNNYIGRTNFTIIWKMTVHDNDNGNSISNYFRNKSRPIQPIQNANGENWPYYLGRGGALAVTTDPQTGAHTIYSRDNQVKALNLYQRTHEPNQALTRFDFTPPKQSGVHANRNFRYTVSRYNNSEDGIEVRNKRKANVECQICGKPFNPLWRRQHRCRNCNQIICSECSVHEIDEKTSKQAVVKRRVCLTCVAGIRPILDTDPLWPTHVVQQAAPPPPPPPPPPGRASFGINPGFNPRES